VSGHNLLVSLIRAQPTLRVATLARALMRDVREYGYTPARDDMLREREMLREAVDSERLHDLRRAWALVQRSLDPDDLD
jgi:hypothetical protein